MRGTKATVRTARKRKAPAPRRKSAKSKPCAHTHANYDTMWRGERLTVRGCYAIVSDDPHFGYGENRAIFGARCADCGAALSLGPSNDDSPAVQVEMRAAELDAWYVVDNLSASPGDGWSEFEVDGWRAHCSEGDLVGSFPFERLIRPSFDAGWLACEMTMHDARTDRDATAWAWRIDRPIAEQLAETAADDAAADALAVELLREIDDERAAANTAALDAKGPAWNALNDAFDAADADLQAGGPAMTTAEEVALFVSAATGAASFDALEYELTRDAEPDCRDEDGPEVERIMESTDE